MYTHIHTDERWESNEEMCITSVRGYVFELITGFGYNVYGCATKQPVLDLTSSGRSCRWLYTRRPVDWFIQPMAVHTANQAGFTT